MKMKQNPWTTISQRIVYRNPWISVREDQVIRPDGREGIYGVVLMPESVGVVAIDDDDRVALVGQWRYVHQCYALEIPTGGIESGEERLDAAKRELREETGLVADHWESLGAIENSNGATTDVTHMYRATGLHAGTKAALGDEQTELVWVAFDEALSLVQGGEIRESTSVAAMLKVQLARRSDG